MRRACRRACEFIALICSAALGGGEFSSMCAKIQLRRLRSVEFIQLFCFLIGNVKTSSSQISWQGKLVGELVEETPENFLGKVLETFLTVISVYKIVDFSSFQILEVI